MIRPEKHKLYVNLSASQTRKRLKGHGFGVKRIESAGRNQAVIVHTATGGHLQQLKQLLGDVVSADEATSLDTPVANLRNLGPTSAAWLREIGVQHRADLQDLGAVAAFQRVRLRHPDVGWSLLYSLAAALQDRDWHDLDDQEREQLRREV